MQLQSQVCSLELAKQLKALGVKQESLFYWVDGEILCGKYDTYWYVNHKGKIAYETTGCGCCANGGDINELYCAFTVAELGEILPAWCVTKPFRHPKLGRIYEIGSMAWDNKTIYEWNCDVSDENEANARAKMIVYLLQNKIINNKEFIKKD